MKNKLVKKIGIGLILPLYLGLNSCTKSYEIDGSQVTEGVFTFNKVVEQKGKNLIRYSLAGDLFRNHDLSIIINGEKYTKKDTSVYKVGYERYGSLLNKIDSIRNAKKDLEIQKKIEKEMEKINEALEILGQPNKLEKGVK